MRTAPMLRSEMDSLGIIQWLAVMRDCGKVSELDNCAERETAALTIGSALVSILATLAKHTTSAGESIPAMRWQHRGPDASIGDFFAFRQRLGEQLGRTAATAISAMKCSGDRQNVAANMLACQLLGKAIYDAESTSLYTVAGYYKVSLRECFETYARTRESIYQKNKNRFKKRP